MEYELDRRIMFILSKKNALVKARFSNKAQVFDMEICVMHFDFILNETFYQKEK